jgi:2-succinyl-5-enolpyruvyl-6-hydroxy-3-cyclohexene-1-carboxylate synthase
MTAGIGNRVWGRAIVDALVGAGAGGFFVSPGARSSPLVAALEGYAGSMMVHYDERGSGFAALGHAVATGRFSVVVTTSGTAVANLLPACVEASYSWVPLVLLTADRPPALRGLGANQTIDQRGIFSSHVRAAFELPCPEGGGGDVLGDVLGRAVLAATGLNPGPVHVNVPFDEPLLPEAGGKGGVVATVGAAHPPSPPACEVPGGEFFRNPRGVLVIGRMDAREQSMAPAVVDLGRRLGWPVFADVLSGARFLPGVVRHADWILQREGVPAPGRVLHLGGSLVSKRLGRWLARCGGEDHWQVRSVPGLFDPYGANPRATCGDVEGFVAAVGALVEDGRRGWVDDWAAADCLTAEVLGGLLDGTTPLTEPAVGRVAARIAGQRGAVLFLGNSMPVRDVDACADTVGVLPVFGNRGASGIDGNVATIAGIAMGTGRPVIGLVGDQTLLHDLNSLPLLRGLPVALVVVNNGGGGIFRFLPLATDDRARSRYWEAAHGFDFRAAAAQFGLRHVQVSGRSDLEEALGSAGPVVIECRGEIGANVAFHGTIAEAVRGARTGWPWA